MKISISDAAKYSKISRQHLYTKYIKTGALSVDRSTPQKPVIDVSELLRVFPNISLPDTIPVTDRQDITLELSSKITDLDKELTATRKLLTDSQEREKWLQGTVDKLTDTIKLLEHREQPEPARRGFWSRFFGGK